MASMDRQKSYDQLNIAISIHFSLPLSLNIAASDSVWLPRYVCAGVEYQ